MANPTRRDAREKIFREKFYKGEWKKPTREDRVRINLLTNAYYSTEEWKTPPYELDPTVWQLFEKKKGATETRILAPKGANVEVYIGTIKAARDNLKLRALPRDTKIVPSMEPIPGRREPPKPQFYTEEFKQYVKFAYAGALYNLGPKIITYIQKRMKKGEYKRWWSKRPREYFEKGNLITPSRAKSPRVVFSRHEKIDRTPLYVARAALIKKIKKGKSSGVRLTKKLDLLKEQIRMSEEFVQHYSIRVRTPEAYKYYPTGMQYGVKKVYKKTPLGKYHIEQPKYLKEGGYGIFHWSAHPGMFPAPDTERLKRSLRFEVVRVPGRELAALQIGAYVGYAKALELGSKKAKARPFLAPAIRHFGSKIGAEVAKVYRESKGRKLGVPTESLKTPFTLKAAPIKVRSMPWREDWMTEAQYKRLQFIQRIRDYERDYEMNFPKGL